MPDWPWREPAQPTETSRPKSTRTAFGLRNWTTIPANSYPKSLRNAGEGDAVRIDLNQPMSEICKILSQYPVSTRVSLNGTIIVARDIAHAKLKARLDAGEDLPQYFKDHPVLYAGPAKTPRGYALRLDGPDHGQPHGSVC